MTTPNPQIPAAFTNDDFAARMRRVVTAAVERALAGVIVTPGPDLVWLTGSIPLRSLSVIWCSGTWRCCARRRRARRTPVKVAES
jgi:hypothetical protein